jgi:DNA-binding CsgD family transcriptional regulator
LTERQRAAAELHSCGVSEAAGNAGPHGPELDVRRLVAADRTNPQTAEALYISSKTAGHNVSNILTKLGVATRAEAAGVAHRLCVNRDQDPKWGTASVNE